MQYPDGMSESEAASTASDLEAIRTFLDDFGRLPAHAERSPTFMEIAGYPHYENVCSNILAFFLDSKTQHGLGTLALDALMDTEDTVNPNQDLGGNISVEREVYTDSGNRIDILIESDTHVILIENKLLAGVANPFGDYARFANRRGGRDVARVKLLLTLFPSEEGAEWGFENLTYATFVDRIRSRLGHHASVADTRYLTMLLDFLNTLDNLQEGTRMNQDFVRLLSERQQDVENLLSELKAFTDELRQKVRELRDVIDIDKHDNVHQQLYRERMGLFDDLAHDITISEDLTAKVDTVIEPGGWYINIWAYKSDPEKLRMVLERLQIPFERESDPKHFNYPERFDYSENLDRVRSVVQDLVDRLAAAHTENTGP